MGEMELVAEDLVTNPAARVPVCLCLDTSGSMGGAPIEELNEGVAEFFSAVKSDEKARWSAEVAIVTFGGSAEKVTDFGSILEQEAPRLSAGGGTPMGAAVSLALDLLEARKKEYSDAGTEYYQPWLLVMTDGAPTDSIDEAARRTSELSERRKLSVFPIGVGEGADMSVLARFSPRRPPLRLKGLNFRELFEWLSKSLAAVSRSVPGQSAPLDTAGIGAWGEI